MKFLEIVNLTKTFKNHVAVNNVSLSVDKGEFVVILGPSGSGKSTLLRLIAGLEDPDSGDIYLDGVRINDVDPKDRDIAMVFQTYAIYPHMTVYQNIEFPLRMRKVPIEERRKKIREVAELLKITHLLEKKAWALSGGEQQRVALARALVRNPKLFLLDEPLSNLDAKLRVKLRFELRKLLHDELGITTLYVTHDQVEAMTMADKIAIMNEGKIIQFGTPPEVFNNPKNLFVATFIGTPPMNILRGKWVKPGHLLIGDIKVIPKQSLDLAENVVIGIRPQHLAITRDGPGIKGIVTSYENLGEEVILHVDTPAGEVQLLVPWSELRELSRGTEMRIRPVDKVYVFNESTGDLIKILNVNEYSIE